MSKNAPIRRCTKVEVIGTKDGKERVIGVVILKDGRAEVESEDKEFKEKAEGYLNTIEFNLVLSEKEPQCFLQSSLDPYFLEALVGPEGLKEKEFYGYTNVWVRRAGRIWEEPFEEGKIKRWKPRILRCDKVEICSMNLKTREIKVIAIVTVKDGKAVVESEDKYFKEKAEEFLNTGEKWLRWSYTDTLGYKKQILTAQGPGDPYFLEAISGPWSSGKELWGYAEVFAREAGKIWWEEIPEGMICDKR